MTVPTVGFHRWLSVDTDPDQQPEDQCLGCGVTTPDFGTGVVSDHSPLPIMCPGPDGTGPWPAHHFAAMPDDALQCHWCNLVIDGSTLPADVEWRCCPGDLWECPSHPGSTPDHADSDGTVLWSCGCMT